MSNQIRSGQSIDIPIGAAQSIAVGAINGTYTLTITAGASAGSALATAASGATLYGPYTDPINVRLVAGADSLIDYEAGATPSLDYRPAATVGIAVTASKVLTGASVDQVLDCNSASAIVLTVPQDDVLGLSVANDRRSIAAYQAGAGATTWLAGSGVTIRGTAPTAAQYLLSGIVRVGANEWAYV